VPPGPVVPGFLVTAVLAVEQGELGGGGGGELAEPGRDEAGFAVAGEPGDADPGETAQRQVPVVAEVVPADVQHIGNVRQIGAGRAALGAERLGERVGAQGADDESAGCGLGDADADGPPVVGDVSGLLLDLFTAGPRRGFDSALPAVAGEPQAPGTRVADLPGPLGGLDADQEREQPAAEREQDQEERMGLGSRPVLRGKFGLGQAGAAAQPVPPVPGPDHAGVMAAGGRGRGREPD
jgi:hypothetical protein